MEESKKKYIGFKIAGVLLILSAFLALALQISDLANSNFDKVRFTVPGYKEITFEKAGRYVVFYEYKSDYAGGNYNTKSVSLSDLVISITEARSGTAVDWFYSNATTRYDFKNAGVSWVKFNLSAPTTIRIDAFYKNNEGPEIVLLVAGNFVLTVLKKVFIMIVSFFGLIVIGVIMFFIPIIYTRRKRIRTDKNTNSISN